MSYIGGTGYGRNEDGVMTAETQTHAIYVECSECRWYHRPPNVSAGRAAAHRHTAATAHTTAMEFTKRHVYTVQP